MPQVLPDCDLLELLKVLLRHQVDRAVIAPVQAELELIDVSCLEKTVVEGVIQHLRPVMRVVIECEKRDTVFDSPPDMPVRGIRRTFTIVTEQRMLCLIARFDAV